MSASTEDKHNPCDYNDENHGHEDGSRHKHVRMIRDHDYSLFSRLECIGYLSLQKEALLIWIPFRL
jgi:hypothetical protein